MKINKPTKLTDIEMPEVGVRGGVGEMSEPHLHLFLFKYIEFFKILWLFSPLSPILMWKWRKDFGHLLKNWIFIPQTVTDLALLFFK